jgi:hypothetical protein
MKKNLLIASGAIAVCAAIILAFSSFRPADMDEEGYATMIVYENFSIVNCKIIVTYPDEQTEIVDLGPFKYNDDFLINNSIIITRTLNDLKKRGYEVISMTASGKINSNKAMRITTIILEKG